MITLLVMAFVSSARAEWFCETGASEKTAQVILACGVDTDPTENGARKKALAAAFEELDTVCDRSVDCKSFELEIEPARSDCRREGAGYKCYRAIRATITEKKRRGSYQKGESLKAEREKIDIVVHVEPRDVAALKAEPKCRTDLEPLSRALLDISTREKQDAMAREAVKVPFEPECASVHYRVLSILTRYGISLPAYDDFLMQSLSRIADPSADDRAYAVLEYFSKLGPMPEKQWQASLEVIKKTPTHSLYRLLPRLFYGQAAGDQRQKTERQRVDRVFEAAQAQQLGKPLPLKANETMELVLRSLKSYRLRDQAWLAVHAFEAHRAGLDPADSPQKLARSLKTLVNDAKDPMSRARANELLADWVKKAAPSYELSRELEPYLEEFGRELAKQDDEEDDGMRRIAELKKLRADFIERSGPNLGKNLAITRQEYERKSRMLLCLDLALACDDLVPDTERLSKLLRSKKAQKRLEALEAVAKMPAAAKQLEGDLIQNLKDADEGEIENSNAILSKTVLALAAIPTRNAEALKLMVDLHLRSRLSFQDVRPQLGPGIEPYLVKELQSRSERHHMAILLELDEHKKLSPATCKVLRELAAKKDPYYVRDGAEKALRRCK